MADSLSVFAIQMTNGDTRDASGAEHKEVGWTTWQYSLAYIDSNMTQELDTSTAILKKKKKPNSLM